MKKICVITGSRAEYGLLQSLMRLIKQSKSLQLQILATGMHLSPEFGLTYKSIEEDGFVIDEKVEMLLSADTDVAVVKSTGLGMIGFADALRRLEPDLIIILGDRFEIFSAASAAYLMKLPIAHLHGGELTEGATDDALRHAITKMSYLHFTSTETYRKRVIQLGEDPARVYNFGAIGIDAIKNLNLLPKDQLEASLGIKLGARILLVTYHPVTMEHHTAALQMEELTMALQDFVDCTIIFTMPNADADGRIIMQKIDDFVSKNEFAFAFKSLGQLSYLSVMNIASVVIGNSSSGIIEAPSLGVPTINIGDRQKGRLSSTTVTDVVAEKNAIKAAIVHALQPEYKDWCTKQTNPYGDGGTSTKILGTIETMNNITDLKKKFYDN